MMIIIIIIMGCLLKAKINWRKTQSWAPQEEIHVQYKDNLKANLKWAGIKPKELETAASNRSE